MCLGNAHQRISKPIEHELAEGLVGIALCHLSLGLFLARPEQAEGCAYVSDLALAAVVKLEVAVHFADQDIDNVVLQLGHAHVTGKNPEVHQLRPRHSVFGTARAECSVSGKDSVAVHPFQEMNQGGGGGNG